MRSIFLPIIIAISLLVGCNKSSPKAVKALNRAEAVMEEHPDSAFKILSALDTATLCSDADRALYALLYTQARDKNYHNDTSDVLINRAVNYYRKNNDAQYTMLAHYYKGRIHENAQDYGEALYQLMRGYKLAEELKADLWTGRISRSISDLYTTTMNSDEAIRFANIAYDAMVRTGNQRFIRESFFDYVRAFHNAKRYDTALTLYPSLLKMGIQSQDSVFINSVRGLYGKTLIGVGQSSKAIEVLEPLYHPIDSTNNWIGYLLLAYVNSGDLTKASQIIANHGLNEMSYHGGMYSYYKQTKEYDKALRALEQQNRLGNKDLSWIMGQNLTGSLTKLIEDEDRTHKAEVKAERMIWTTSIILVVSILGILAIFIIYRYKTKQNQLLARLESMNEVTKDYQDICGKLETLQNNILHNKYKLVDSFFSSTFVEGDDEKVRKKFLSSLIKKLNEIGNDEEAQKEIESWVDNNADNVMSEFRNLPLSLKEADYKIFLYSVLGFSHNTMAALIDAPDLMSVYNRRKRLKNKLKSLQNDQPNTNIAKYLKYLNEGKRPEKDAHTSVL